MCSVDWTALAAWAAVAVAILALVVARQQLVAARVTIAENAKLSRESARHDASLAREMASLQTWNDYLKLCVERPEFSSSDLFKRSFGAAKLKGLASQLEPDTERYLWFISLMLNGCEQVLLGMPASQDWWDTLADQVKYHGEAIEQIWPRWERHYAAKMRSLVQEGLRRANADS